MATKKHIVLIDDDQDACELLKMQLEDTNSFSVDFSIRSEDLMDLIQKKSPDVIILDINMPEQNGVELAGILATDLKTASIPIIYLSGIVTPAEVEELTGAEELKTLVSKGSPLSDLINAINTQTAG